MIISCSLIIHTVDCMFSNAVLKPEERRPWFLRCCSQFKIVYNYILWGTIVWVHSKTNAKAVLVCSLVFPQRWQTPSFAAFFCQTSLMCNDLKYFVLKKSDDCANDPVPQCVVSFRLHLLTPPIQIRVATYFQDKYSFQDTFFHEIIYTNICIFNWASNVSSDHRNS